MELVKHPFKAQVTYPFRTANRKGASKPSVDKPEKTESPEDDPGEGPSGSGHRKKRKRESGRIYPKDSSKFRKYGQNMYAQKFICFNKEFPLSRRSICLKP